MKSKKILSQNVYMDVLYGRGFGSTIYTAKVIMSDGSALDCSFTSFSNNALYPNHLMEKTKEQLERFISSIQKKEFKLAKRGSF
jgi:hypothetical protein